MEKKIWFIYSDQIVSGPFSTQEVRKELDQGRWAINSSIWWKGQREWMPLRTWQSQLTKILRTEEEKGLRPVWYVHLGESPIGPLTPDELYAHLRALSNLSGVRLWTVGMNKWANAFDLHEIMDQLGLSRRANERAPLMGTVVLTRLSEDATPMITRAASISAAGIGVNDAHDLDRGDEVNVLIKSPEFQHPIRVRAKAAYVTPDGYAGLKFEVVHAETRSLLLDYIKKFNRSEEAKRSA